MVRIIDVRNSGGQLAVLGEAIVLPSSNSNSKVPEGSIRFNPITNNLEVYTSGWKSAAATNAVSLDDVVDAIIERSGNAFAGFESPEFTGQPKAPTLEIENNSDAIATTKFVKSQGYIKENQNITLRGALQGSGNTDINVRLSPIAPKTILANTYIRPNEPIETKITTLLDSVFGSEAGSILYRGQRGWTVVAPGKKNQKLQTDGQNLQWINEDELSFTDVVAALGYTPLQTISYETIIKLLGYIPLPSNASGLSVSFSGNVIAAPLHRGQILFRTILGFPVTFLKGLPDSSIICSYPASENIILEIFKNALPIGSVKFTKGKAKGIVTFIHDVSLKIGDILEIQAPNPADSTFGDITFTLVGLR